MVCVYASILVLAAMSGRLSHHKKRADEAVRPWMKTDSNLRAQVRHKLGAVGRDLGEVCRHFIQLVGDIGDKGLNVRLEFVRGVRVAVGRGEDGLTVVEERVMV